MRKIIRLFGIFACTLLLLSGCSSKYERDSEPGRIETITVAQMQEMIERKESFAIVFTQTTCSHCIEFKEMLDGYLLNHHVVLYDVVLDEAPQSQRQSDLSKIRETFEGMNETPSLYYVEDGEMEDQLENGEDGLTREKFDNWVQRYKLDEKQS